MLSGPGSIAVTSGFTSPARHWLDYVAIILGIVVVAVITHLSSRLSDPVVRVIGPNEVLGIVTDPSLLKGLRDALK